MFCITQKLKWDRARIQTNLTGSDPKIHYFLCCKRPNKFVRHDTSSTVHLSRVRKGYCNLVGCILQAEMKLKHGNSF